MEMSRWLRTNMQTSAWPLDRCCHITVHLWNQQPQYASGKKHASQRAACIVSAPGITACVAIQIIYRYHPSTDRAAQGAGTSPRMGSGWDVLLAAVAEPAEWRLRTRCNFCVNNEIINTCACRLQTKSLSWNNTKGVKGVFFVEHKAELPCSRLQHTDSGKCVRTDRTLLSKPGWLLAQASNAACEDLTPDNLMDTVWVLEAREAKKMKYLSVSCSVSWDI